MDQNVEASRRWTLLQGCPGVSSPISVTGAYCFPPVSASVSPNQTLYCIESTPADLAQNSSSSQLLSDARIRRIYLVV